MTALPPLPSSAWAGHLWTVLPTLRDLVLRPRLAAMVPVEVPIVDDRFGATSLSCSMARPLAAQDCVILVHGLGGHRHSAYVQRAARTLFAAGFATLAVDLRGADRRGGGFYHVAQSEDLAAVCASAVLRPFRRLFVLGFSMGGHVAIHFAARPTDARLAGVAAFGTPLDLHAAQRHLDQPAQALYRRFVLHGLKSIYAAVAARHEVPSPLRAVRACRTFHEWDRLAIAPRYGYASPAAFYAANSAASVLPQLRVDTVLVAVEQDPIVPPALVLPYTGCAPVGRLHVCCLPRGGHLHVPDGQGLGLGVSARSLVGQLAAWWRRLPAEPLPFAPARGAAPTSCTR